MSGTFVNSNSFGCFVGMALVTALALLFGKAPTRRRSVRQDEDEFDDRDSALSWLTGTKVALIAVALLCMGGMLISGSRAGFASTAVGVAVLGALVARGSSLSRTALRWAVLAGVGVAIVVGVIAGGAMIRKTATLKNADTLNRLVIWRASLDAIRQSPWLGWGLGSYADAYTVNQPIEIPQPNDKAHSTPIEIVVELGVPAGLAAIAAVLIPWGVGLRGALQRRRQRYLPAAAFVAAGVAILHSTVDFSLQIPAIGFFVSALLGLGWAQTFAHNVAAEPAFTDDE
jgi:O-antigen ligase